MLQTQALHYNSGLIWNYVERNLITPFTFGIGGIKDILEIYPS